MKIIPTGKTVYLVHKGWLKAKNNGAKVTPARVTGYQNLEGKIVPLLRSGKMDYDAGKHHIFFDINEAVDAIRTK